MSGTYFVYSHVDLFEECRPGISNAGRDEHIKHAIYKFNILNEEEVKLTESKEPRLICYTNYLNSYSFYIFTLVELSAGDELSVKISNISYLTYPNNNYFGLNLI